MSRWSEDFNNHKLHSTLKSLREISEARPKGLGTEEITELRRLRKILDILENTLQQVDPEIVPTPTLDTINQGLEHDHIQGNLVRYTTEEPSLSQLVQANDQLSALLPSINYLLAFSQKIEDSKRVASVEKTFENFISNISEAQTEHDEKVNQQDTELNELKSLSESVRANFKELEQDVSNSKNQWQEQFTNDQSARQTEFSQDQADRKSEFSNSQSAWVSEFSDWFSTYKSTADDALEARHKTFDENLAEKILDAESKHQRILDLHGLVAGDAVTAGYLEDGKSERSAANFWRWVSISFILLTIAWLAFAYWLAYTHPSTSEAPWEALARTASLTGVLLVGAAYASRQSKAHRDQERKARWFGLEVKTFDPFISSLSDEQQKALREKLADKLFGQQQTVEPDTAAHMDNDMFKTLSDLVLKLAPRN